MDISLINIILTFISLAFIFLLFFSFKLKNQRDKLIIDNNKLELEIITKNNELLVSKKELEIIKNNTTTIEKINSTLLNQSKLEFENFMFFHCLWQIFHSQEMFSIWAQPWALDPMQGVQRAQPPAGDA